MKHEHFKSLDVQAVVPHVLKSIAKATRAKKIEWVSFEGLKSVDHAEAQSHHFFHWPFNARTNFLRLQVTLHKKILPVISTLKGPRWVEDDLLVYPVVYEKELVGLFLITGTWRVATQRSIVSKVRMSLTNAARYLSFSYQLQSAKSMSFIDELTGLYNQRYMAQMLDHEIESHRRKKSKFCLLFMDVDYFKSVNDQRGHWVGSKLLTEVGAVLKKQVRSCDYCFRYGGDEFVILLDGADAQKSTQVAERIRSAIEGHPFSVEGHNLNLTVSIGLAEYPTHAETAAQMIQIADMAMYEGKKKSRNIVFIAS